MFGVSLLRVDQSDAACPLRTRYSFGSIGEKAQEGPVIGLRQPFPLVRCAASDYLAGLYWDFMAPPDDATDILF